ncbi:MAG: ANTAR domain-containing protein [Oscillospiraceae bacterium]|nr:ANTAR domain-containing protein [Oscillospiraceae bacterium]
MEKVIIAFESEQNCRKIREILEHTGTACCVICRSAAEVKRVVSKQRISTVICGYKFADGSAEALFGDLPPYCSMLVIAVQSLLDLMDNTDIFQLPSPVSKGDLAASVRILLQMGRRLERLVRPNRSAEELAILAQAKGLLMDQRGMTEEEAHRWLQKTSMDTGARLLQTALDLLSSGWSTPQQK